AGDVHGTALSGGGSGEPVAPYSVEGPEPRGEPADRDRAGDRQHQLIKDEDQRALVTSEENAARNTVLNPRSHVPPPRRAGCGYLLHMRDRRAGESAFWGERVNLR